MSRTAPPNPRKIMRCFRRVNSTSLRNPYVHVCSRTIDRQHAICQRLLLKTGHERLKYRSHCQSVSLTAGFEQNQIVHFPSPQSLPSLSFAHPFHTTPLIVGVNNFMRIRIAPDNVFGSSRSLALPRVANESLSPLPKAFR